MPKIDRHHTGFDPAHTQSSTNDDALFARLAHGDVQALRFLFYRYGPLLRSMLLAMLGPTPDVDGVLQDAFLQLWQDPNSYQAKFGTFKAWLVLQVRRLALHHIHKMALAGHMKDWTASHPDLRPSGQQILPRTLQHRTFWQQLSPTEQMILQLLFLGPLASHPHSLSPELIDYHLQNIQRRFITHAHQVTEKTGRL